MSRTKTGFVRRRWHKKILKHMKGAWGTRHSLHRRANEAMIKAFFYAYRDRRQRKRDLRRLWIVRINAGARLNGMSYSRLMYGLKNANVEVDRKMLADIAVRDPQTFTKIVALSMQNPTPTSAAPAPIRLRVPVSRMMVEEVVEEASAEPAAPIRIRATPKPKVEAPAEPKVEAPAAPKAEAEPVVEEAAPKARTSRKKGAGDDLTVVEGIGPKIAAALVAAGIDTFDKLAHASEDDLRKALEAASLRFAPSLPTWAKQAAYAAQGDFDGLKAYQDTLTGGRE